MSIKTLKLHEQSKADGVIRISIPTGEPGSAFRLTVHIEPDVAPVESSPKAWSPGFLDTIVGGWTGDFVED